MNHNKEYIIVALILKFAILHTTSAEQHSTNNPTAIVSANSLVMNEGNSNDVIKARKPIKVSDNGDTVMFDYIKRLQYGDYNDSDKSILLKSNIKQQHRYPRSNVISEKHEKNRSQLTIKKNIYFAVLLPPTIPLVQHTNISALVLTAMDLAIRKLRSNNGLLSKYHVFYEYKDTNCSSTYGPLAAFDLYIINRPDAFFGPICDYVLAPVSRYAGVWGVPVITTGGVAESFNHKVIISKFFKTENEKKTSLIVFYFKSDKIAKDFIT